jgi:epsilon-lactone hydrolase
MVSLRARMTRALLSSSAKIPWTAKPRFPSIEEASAWSPGDIRQVIEQRRARMERLARRNPPLEGTGFQAADADGVRAEWVAAPGVSQSQAVLYFHGGGYYGGSVTTHRSLAAHISREADARVLLADYRLAPENPFPAAVEDARRAYCWLLRQGLSPERLALAGDSAGGGLAVAAMLALKASGDTLPCAGVCLSPWLDLALTGQSLETKAPLDPILRASDLPFVARMYLGSADPTTPTASPLYGDLADLPPIFIQVGADEILIDDALRFAERARRRGVSVHLEIWDGMFHVWQAYTRLVPEARRAIARIGEFLRTTWGPSL